MDWARNNKFLASYLAFVAIAAAVLAYLVFSSYGRYTQASGDYNSQVLEMKRLQNLAPYPEPGNLRNYNEVAKSYAATALDLQKKLAAYQPAPDKRTPTPLEFQDRLRRVVEEVTRSAQNAGVLLPENFYLGFEQYRGAPPDAAATPDLSAELDAVRELIDIMIGEHVERVTSLVRPPLARESAGGASATAAKSAASAVTPVSIVTRNPLQVEFDALPTVFRATLNKMTRAPRLYVISTLRVKNEKDKGPLRVLAGGRPAPPPAGPCSGRQQRRSRRRRPPRFGLTLCGRSGKAQYCRPDRTGLGGSAAGRGGASALGTTRFPFLRPLIV